MPPLPVELLQEVFSLLAAPSHEYQFKHQNFDVMYTLRQLCLVNRCVYNLSTPLLYSYISIYNLRQYKALIWSLNRHATLTRYAKALWLFCFPGAVDAVHEILYILGPHLRFLAITDTAMTNFRASSRVRDAMEKHCSSLELFAHIQGNYVGDSDQIYISSLMPSWLCWGKLHRLVLDRPRIDDEFVNNIHKMYHLSHLTLIDPQWEGDVGILYHLLDPGIADPQDESALRVIHLIFHLIVSPEGFDSASTQGFLRRLRDISALTRSVDESFERVRLRHTTVVGDNEPIAMTYTRDLVFRGTVWDVSDSNIYLAGGASQFQ